MRQVIYRVDHSGRSCPKPSFLSRRNRVVAPGLPAFARFHFPAYTALRRHLDAYVTYYNHHRAHTGRITAGRCPAELIHGTRKMEPR